VAKWVVGQSGNPNGRPRRGRAIAELARAIGQERIRFDDEGEIGVFTRLERLVRVLWTLALAGDLAAARLLLEYMEGKPVEILRATVEGQVVELSGDEMAATFGKALAVVAEWRQVRMIGTRGDEAEGDAGAG